MKWFATSARSLACLLVLQTSSAMAVDAGEEGWSGQLTPYLWAAGMGGTLTPFTGAPTLRTDRSFGDILEDVDASFFITGFARRGRTVFLTDFSYSKSSKDGLVPPGIPGEGTLRQRSLTLAGGWRAVEEDSVKLDLLLGLRNWSVRADVEVPLAGISRSPSKSFTDPLLVARANFSLAADWSLITYVDVGVFGASEKTYQWLASLNYAHSERWAFSGGLRQLRVDYRSDGTRADITLMGPLLGASWRF